MSQAELSRLQTMANLATKSITQVQAGVRLGISERQVRRLWRRFQTNQAAGIVSRRRGKPSNNRLSTELVQRALELVAQRYSDFGPTFANEKLRELHGLHLGTETLRQAMIRANLWKSKNKRRKPIHPPRERRPQFGELIQIDGSPHDWFEGRAPRCSLIVFIDDATSKLINLRFVPAETTWAYFRTLRTAIEQYGRPLALYSDKHSIFRAPNALHTDAQTQFGRALNELGIELICANSPQAKGRVERANRTLQNRLIRELRLRNTSTMNVANAFLPSFIRDYNQRFAQAAFSNTDAHRSVDGFDLDSIIALRTCKRLSKDCTLQLHRDIYPADDPQAYNYQRVNVTEHEDGSFTVTDQESAMPIHIRRLRSLNEQAQIRTAKELNPHLDRPPRRPELKPSKSPWRSNFKLPGSP
jgi:hypothetical protein